MKATNFAVVAKTRRTNRPNEHQFPAKLPVRECPLILISCGRTAVLICWEADTESCRSLQAALRALPARNRVDARCQKRAQSQT